MDQQKTELRGSVPTALAAALDALAMAEGVDRHSFITAVLERTVQEAARKQRLLQRVTRGNPYFEEPAGGDPDCCPGYSAGAGGLAP